MYMKIVIAGFSIIGKSNYIVSDLSGYSARRSDEDSSKVSLIITVHSREQNSEKRLPQFSTKPTYTSNSSCGATDPPIAQEKPPPSELLTSSLLKLA
jgi:hypothetical protein